MKTASEICWCPSVGSPGSSGGTPNTGTDPEAVNGTGGGVVGGAPGNVVEEDDGGVVVDVVDVDVVEPEEVDVVVDLGRVVVVDVVEPAEVGVVVDVVEPEEVGVVVDVVEPPDVSVPGGTDWADAPTGHIDAITRTRRPIVSVATKDRTRMVPNISPPNVGPHEQ